MHFRPKLAIFFAFGLLLAFAYSKSSPPSDTDKNLAATSFDASDEFISGVQGLEDLFARKLHLSPKQKPKPQPKPHPTPKTKSTEQSPKTSHEHTATYAHTTATSHSKTTHTSSQTPTSTSIGRPLSRQRCSAQSCGGTSCAGNSKNSKTSTASKRVARGSSLKPLAFLKSRAFATIRDGTQDVFTLAKRDGNIDLTVVDEAKGFTASGFVAFGGNDKSMTMTKLHGCVGIIVVSEEGMWAAHVLERDEKNGVPNEVDPKDLSPWGYKNMMETISSELRPLRSKFSLVKSGELHVMIPYGFWDEKDGEENKDKFKKSYDYDKIWPGKGKDKKGQVKGTLGEPYKIPDHIFNTLKEATGLEPNKHQYLAVENVEDIEKGTRGTLALQYSPNQGGKHAFKVWVEGKPKRQREWGDVAMGGSSSKRSFFSILFRL